MITFVRLKNWKSHRNTELRFGDGTNVLVGMMGAGKSSVMEGITYALFGTLPAIQARRIKLEDVITSRPRPQNRAEVEVGFLTPEGEEYVVKRGAYLLQDGREGDGEALGLFGPPREPDRLSFRDLVALAREGQYDRVV